MKLTGTVGRAWGNIGHVNRMVKFGTSPYETRAFPSIMQKPYSVFLRFRRQTLLVIPPLYLTYMAYKYLQVESHRFRSKDPAEFANDQ
ncbi:cytochrome b-c1 complex subunit 8-like [Mya arenaria]|nr:cytochrome b-c1 complex subunit 8-like [Mya arenaria]